MYCTRQDLTSEVIYWKWCKFKAGFHWTGFDFRSNVFTEIEL